MRYPGVILFVILTAAAQNQTGRIEGVVTDAISHQPVRKASVTLMPASGPPTPRTGRGTETQNVEPRSAATGADGTFVFDDLPAGKYQILISHQNYPEARFGGLRKSVQVTAGETAPKIVAELLQGAAVSGHILDEDGDPLNGCYPQLRPAKGRRGTAYRTESSAEDGSYRISGIPPGKYILIARCQTAVFQPRPLSVGPDPPPSAAYAPQFYPAASEAKSAEVLNLSPGTEKSAVDFQMRPAAATHVHGKIVGAVDWRGRHMRMTLFPASTEDERPTMFASMARIDEENGSFDISNVFPGAYKLVAFTIPTSRGEMGTAAGTVTQVQVADKPVEIDLQLHSALEIHGQIQVEPGVEASNHDTSNQNVLNRYGVRLEVDDDVYNRPFARVADDGAFVLKAVFPGRTHIRLIAPNGFLKSASYGGVEIKDGELDLTSGIAAPLQLIVSTKVAAVRGTAPAGLMVFARSVDDRRAANAPADASGHFVIQNLAPGKYRLAALPEGAEMPEDGSQEVTVAEGETATVDVRAVDNP